MKRKGISPLIAVVLLVVFTVAIATIIMSWARTYTKRTSGTIDVSSEEMLSCTDVSVEIEDVYITIGSTENITRVIIRNLDSNTTLESAKVYNSTGSFCPLNTSGVGTLSKGIEITLENTSCNIFNAGCGNFHKASVTTPCGGGGDEFTDKNRVHCVVN